MYPSSLLPKAVRALLFGSAALLTTLASPAGASSPIKPYKLTLKPAGKTQLTVATPVKTAASRAEALDGTDLFGQFAVPSAGLPGVKIRMPFYGKPGASKAGRSPQGASLFGLPGFSAALVPIITTSIVPPGSDFSGFKGLTNLDQASAGTGFYADTNFDLEPPDQGLAVGGNFVVENVNNAIAVYTKRGTLIAGPTPTNQFYKLGPYAQPGFAPPFGPSLSDIRAYYDPAVKRFFLEEWGTESDPGSGTAVSSFIALAVSDTENPTGTFTLYFIDTTNLSASGVASLPDYTNIGADATGLYLNSNYFSLADGSFQGVSILALSKSSLVSGFGASGYVFPIDPATRPDNAPAFALAPAVTPPGAAYATAAGGTEYFVSSLDPTNTTDTRLDVWALTNTSSIDSFNGEPTLTDTVIKSEAYGAPVPAQQKSGSIPLGASEGASEETLDTDDDRLFTVTYANGALWTACTTIYYQGQGPTGAARDAAAYFDIHPSVSATGVLKAAVTKQGYIVAKGEDVIYPTIAVLPASNNALFSFTLTGPDYFPSAAYVNLADGTNTIYLAHAGAYAEDGFSGYGFFGTGVARWGDYSAAVTGEDGSAWLATEYIPRLPRDEDANWGTFISHIAP